MNEGNKKRPNAKKSASLVRSSAAEYLTFVAASGEGGVEAVYADENVWLSQKMMGVLYDVDVRTINYHLKKIFSDSELDENSVIRNFRITAADGKTYETRHYNLAAIIQDRLYISDFDKVVQNLPTVLRFPVLTMSPQSPPPAAPRPRTRALHAAMDRAVLYAYRWPDIPTACEFLLDYEDEDANDEASAESPISNHKSPRRRRKPYRLRWPDEIRDEVLARLLALNAERAAQERLAGTGKKTTRKTKTALPPQREKAKDEMV